jgi:hypothetical protein
MARVHFGWLVVAIGLMLPVQVQAQIGPMSSGDDWYPGKYMASGWKSMTSSMSTATAKASNWSILPKPTQPTFMQQQPSTMGKMWHSTKEAMYNTADFLNPWYNRPKYPGPFSPTGNTNYLNNRGTPVKKAIGDADETPWWYPYPVEKKYEKPRTVQEWMKQEKPGFN